MKSSLDCRKDFLCVVIESETADGSSIRGWYPVHKAERAEIQTLCGRPLTNISATEGIYVDEEGNVFQLANQGETIPLEVEQVATERKNELETLLEASLNGSRPPPQVDASGQTVGKDDRGRGTKRANRKSVKILPARREESADGITGASNGAEEGSDRDAASRDFARLNLRQKLALVRRRLPTSRNAATTSVPTTTT